jgi:hypothetical protein
MSPKQPFKVDACKERMLYWRDYRPDLWSTLSPAMHQAVEEYEAAMPAVAQGSPEHPDAAR